MDSLVVRLLEDADRPSLADMLSAADDFPATLVYGYLHRRATSSATYVGSWGDRIVGFATVAHGADLRHSPGFSGFLSAPAPHALLERLFVAREFRGQGVGRSIVAELATGASVLGESFIGGALDLSTDSDSRRRFFEQLGFTILPTDYFGANVSDLLGRDSSGRQPG